MFKKIKKYGNHWLLLMLGIVLGWGNAATPEKPNILVILTDDQGYAAVSQNPLHPVTISTPHIDSISKNGVTFSQAYIADNVCSPSRAAILSGRYPQRAKIYTAGEGGRGMSLDNKIIPTFLKPAGYYSGAFGKWHLGTDVNKSPIKRGFDEFFGFLGRGAHDYFKLSDENEPIYRGLEPVKISGYLTDVLTDEACSFITKNKNKPFFCYLAYNAVHTPIEAPAEDVAKFARAKAKDPKYQDKTLGPISTYLAMVERLDAGIGRVLETLQKEGVEQNTLIFFLTDNGGAFDPEQFNVPLHGNKHENWEGGVRTPFYVSWPGHFKQGTSIDAPVISMDILATMIDVTGQPLPTDKPLDGKSLLPLINGETKTLHDKLFWTGGSKTGWWSARVGDWKMLGFKKDVKLFDLSMDIHEDHDLASQNPEKLAEIKKSFDAWISEMPEPMTKAESKIWSEESVTWKEAKNEKKSEKNPDNE
ncbi:MAG: sulfatase-like hydrolase/transferase [Verrucomicrobiota bacterium]